MKHGDVELALSGFGEQHWDKPRKVLETYFNEQEQGNRKVIIAEYGGEIAGYVTLVTYACDGAFKRKGIPEICDFIVFQKLQRCGIGTELMNRIEAEAAKLSDEICLGVGMHSGYGAAQRLHVKRGYIPDGTGVWYGRSKAQQYGAVENSDALVLYMSKKLNEHRDFVESFLTAVTSQDADKLRGLFAENAVVYWHNSNEIFTVDEYVRANCEYPGDWRGEVERVGGGFPLTIVARVWSGASTFRVVSLVELSDDKIRRLDEYWGDVSEPPKWRLDMKIGRKIQS
jgi:GNAT superfamily N-acetyltransferase